MSEVYLWIIAGLYFLISCLLIVSKPEVNMEPDKETLETVQARPDVGGKKTRGAFSRTY